MRAQVQVGAVEGALFSKSAADLRAKRIPRLPDGVTIDYFKARRSLYSHPLTLLPVMELLSDYSEDQDHKEVTLWFEVSGSPDALKAVAYGMRVNGETLPERQFKAVMRRYGIKT